MVKKLVVLFGIAALAAMSGCSVKMAAEKRGSELAEIQECDTRSCLESHDVESMRVEDAPEQVRFYKVRKPTGSTGRAVMHGLLDVATLGLWEIAGTPMEGNLNKDEYYGLRVTYEGDMETIERIELSK